MATTLDTIRNLGDFQQTFRFRLTFLTSPTGVAVDVEGMDARCETAELPKTTNEKIEIALKGLKMFQHGRADYGNSITMTFIETVDSSIKRMLAEWRKAQFDIKTGAMAAPSANLKCDVGITLLNNQNQDVYTFKLIGCLLEDYDLGQMEGATADVQRPSMTLGFDYYDEAAI
jgi:hypothetical protein